jgi:hypothetical protein
MALNRFVRHTPVAALTAIALNLPFSGQGGQRRNDPGWPCTGTIDPSYIRSAEATGGVVMLFKPAEVAGAAEVMQASRLHREVVFRAGGQSPEGEHAFEVPLDATIRSAYVFASMQCLRSVTLSRPSGEELPVDATDVTYRHFEAIRLFTLQNPAPGTWKVRLVGRGVFSLMVMADTDVTLSDVTFSSGGFPVKRERQRLGARVTGALHDIAFHFASPSGAAIESLELQREEEREGAYAGEVVPPEGDFRLAMTGVDERGFRVQRVDARLSVR